MGKDWTEDDSLSADETKALFDALSPEPTSGPPLKASVGLPVPRGLPTLSDLKQVPLRGIKLRGAAGAPSFTH